MFIPYRAVNTIRLLVNTRLLTLYRKITAIFLFFLDSYKSLQWTMWPNFCITES